MPEFQTVLVGDPGLLFWSTSVPDLAPTGPWTAQSDYVEGLLHLPVMFSGASAAQPPPVLTFSDHCCPTKSSTVSVSGIAWAGVTFDWYGMLNFAKPSSRSLTVSE